MATIPTENYLIAIQTLHDENVRCIPARIAERMAVSAPTVTEALKRMSRDGLAEYATGQEVTLTDNGRELALRLMRRHRMVERWLTDVLGLDWATAHEEAHELEHAVSDLVAERLWQSMGRPDACPHGNPIIPITGDPPPRLRLNTVPTGATVYLGRISELAEDNREIMTYFENKGFRPGVRIDVLERGPLNDTLIVRMDSGTAALSEEVAGYLWVQHQQA